MEILVYIFEFIYAAFIAVFLVGSSIMLYDYFLERKFRKSEAKYSESKAYFEAFEDCPDVEDELDGYADCMCDISSINVEIFLASRHLRELNDPELKFALEELKVASDHVSNSLRHIYKLNFPIDEEDLENDKVEVVRCRHCTYSEVDENKNLWCTFYNEKIREMPSGYCWHGKEDLSK